MNCHRYGMDWVLRSPQIHSRFCNLGFLHSDGYHIDDNCNSTLESILHDISTEDNLRSFRRTIHFGQYIQKDLIPLLLHAKENKTIELLVKLFTNLTLPVEGLFSVEFTTQSESGRMIVLEIKKLLASTKAAFADVRVTKVVIDFLKKNVNTEHQCQMAPEQRTNITNSLLLLMNLLHVTEMGTTPCPGRYGFRDAVRNKIIWNIFSQSIDKILIKLMTIPEASNWSIIVVQLLTLLYKDQQVVILQELLNSWLETCTSESSEDNESNTSPTDRGSSDSSINLTSDPPSDSSDTGGSVKSIDEQNSENKAWGVKNDTGEKQSHGDDIHKKDMREHEIFNNDDHMKSDNEDKVISENPQSETVTEQKHSESEKKTIISENTDYGTQIGNQDWSVDSSSNDDEIPAKKPVRQKPRNSKQQINSNVRTGLTPQERKRKTIVKREKASIINTIQGLKHNTPTDDDISNVLKEFTVDFLLKGYNALVRTLHRIILTNVQLEMDRSHFFWLITYFLNFATQIELDLEQISSVLSYDLVSYLTAEGVQLCEELELAIRLDGNNLKSTYGRLHLVVLAIREIIQALEVYKKFTHISTDDQRKIATLQKKVCESEELRSLLVLLLRHYNPKYNAKLYLKDLIVTNHVLLGNLESSINDPEYTGSTDMFYHVRQFATPEMMHQYGSLLEDYPSNGEFVNDCIFTMMHHVGVDLSRLICLFQPKIVKTFTAIWKSDFKIREDWNDLIHYLITTFVKGPESMQSTSKFATENFDGELAKISPPAIALGKEGNQITEVEKLRPGFSTWRNSLKEKRTNKEVFSLRCHHLQYRTKPDVVGEVVKSLKQVVTIKCIDSVPKEMLNQNVINKEDFDKLSMGTPINKQIRDEETENLCNQLRIGGKTECLEWIQKVFLDMCFAKLHLKKSTKEYLSVRKGSNISHYELFNQASSEIPALVSSVSYFSLLFNRTVPLVPWNCEQAAMCKDMRFLKLLNKLGFQMPVDTSKVFIRIPDFWPADFLYELAGRVGPIDTTKLKFSRSDLPHSRAGPAAGAGTSAGRAQDVTVSYARENFCTHSHRHLATMANFTTMPGPAECFRRHESNKRCWLEEVSQYQGIKLPRVMESTSSVRAGGLLRSAPCAPLPPARPGRNS